MTTSRPRISLPAVVVDADGDQAGHVDDAPALAALHHQRVEPDVLVAGRQGPLPEALHVGVEHLREFRDLALRELLDAERLDQVLDPPRGDAEQVRLGHHRSERLLGPSPGLEQPSGEVRPVPELRDLQVDGADPRIPGPPPVPVPGVLPLLVPLPVAGPAGSVDLCAHQRTDHRRQHGLQRVRRRLLDLLAKPLDRIDAGRGGHRSLLGGNHLAGCFLKDDAVAALLNFGASSVHHSTGRYCKGPTGSADPSNA